MIMISLARLNLSASCGGPSHPSQLFVPEVPATVPPQLQPYWLKIQTAHLC